MSNYTIDFFVCLEIFIILSCARSRDKMINQKIYRDIDFSDTTQNTIDTPGVVIYKN